MKKIWLILSIAFVTAVGTAVFVKAFGPAPSSQNSPRVKQTPARPSPSSKGKSDEAQANVASDNAEKKEANSEVPTPLYAGEDAVRLKQFEHTFYDENKNPDGTIRGGLAFWDQEMYEVISPVVVSRVEGKSDDDESTQEGAEEGHNIRLKADRATLVEGKGTVRLYGSVNVDGKDFHITTQDVTYFTSGRRMKSKSPIEVRQYKTNKKGKKETSLLIRGSESSADLTLKQITIRKNPVMKIFNASDGFLSSGKKTQEGKDVSVTVKAKDELIYDHPARKATFTGGVKVLGDGKTLRCKKLTVSIQPDKSGTFSVTDIKAAGRVWLHYGEFTAMGDDLQWQNVTQTCHLTGKDATVSTQNFTLSGSDLTFFRMNNRFQSKGAGELIWTAQNGSERGDNEGNAGLLESSSSGKTKIKWTEKMTFDKSEHWAIFKGQVSADQARTSLAGQVLELQFAENNTRVKKGTVRGGAKLVKSRGGKGDIAFTCEQLQWVPGEATLRLASGKKEQVHVRTPHQELAADEVIFNQNTGMLRCPTSGTMTVAGDTDGKDNASPPVSVQWQKSMEYKRSSPARAFFKGGVEASMRGRTVRGDRLGVTFNEKMEPVEIVASGRARLVSRTDSSPDEQNDTNTNSNTSKPGSSESSLSLPGGAGNMSNWTLECSEFTIHPIKSTLTSDSSGKIVMSSDDSKAPKSIQWSDRMEYIGKDSSALFVGNVQARISGTRLTAERLNADFSKSGGLRYVRAKERVRFSGTDTASWKLHSESAEAIFEGQGELREVIARRNVRVSDKRGNLECGLLHLFFKDPASGQKTPRLARAVAQKNVSVEHISKPDFTAHGDKLSWDYGENQYVLTGDPYARVVRDSTKAKYEKLIINRNTGEVKAPEGSRPGEIEIVPGRN